MTLPWRLFFYWWFLEQRFTKKWRSLECWSFNGGYSDNTSPNYVAFKNGPLKVVPETMVPRKTISRSVLQRNCCSSNRCSWNDCSSGNQSVRQLLLFLKLAWMGKITCVWYCHLPMHALCVSYCTPQIVFWQENGIFAEICQVLRTIRIRALLNICSVLDMLQ